MTEYTLRLELNTALELFGAAIMLILLFQVAREKYKFHEQSVRLFLASLICGAALMLLDAASYFLLYRENYSAFFALRIPNFILFYALTALTSNYLTTLIARRAGISAAARQHINRSVQVVCMIAAVLWIWSLFSGSIIQITDGTIARGRFYWLGQVPGYLVSVVNIVLISCYWNTLGHRDAYAMLLFFLFPFLGTLLHYIAPTLMTHYPMFALSALLCYLFVHADMMEELREKLELSRTELISSKISPHFIFNTLNSIQYLCVTDPHAAQDGIVMFSDYLRQNIDALKGSDLIPFEQELEHILTYLAIQNLRFQDRIHVDFQLGVTQFLVPVLTIEPLVENAVQHGLKEHPEGGNIFLETWEEPTYIAILVIDNGVGFDTRAEPGGDAGAHFGIDAVRTRLSALAGASLELLSQPNDGTAVLVKIPKGGQTL